METIDVVRDLYVLLGKYIPAKQKEEAAIHMIESFIDTELEEELNELQGIDDYIDESLKHHYIIDDEVIEEDDDWE